MWTIYGVAGRFVCRLIAAIAVVAASTAPLYAADIRADIIGGGTRGSGGKMLGPRNVVLEGKIEAGDYDKLRNMYGERGHSEFSLGLSIVNELSLASPGGDVAEAMKIGRLVRALRLQTVIPSRVGPHLAVGMHKLNNPQENYMCASACFFVFVAGVNRVADVSDEPILGIHRPYLPDSELKVMTGDQAISSANQIRAMVENYLKEMNVPPKYADLMFSIPKDQIRWIKGADYHADLQGVIPELKDWLAVRCDKRTDVEKSLWEKMMADPRPIGQQSPAEQSIFDMMERKMRTVRACENGALDDLSADAWLQMFDPKCTIIRNDIADWELAPTEARTFCDRQK
jgi:hypothetical protein